MKTILCILMMMVFFVRNGNGQENENVISVTIPDQGGLDRSQMQILESIAIDIVIHSGYISSYKTWANSMKTLFLIEDENLVQSNKKSMVVIDAKLALTLTNMESGHVFASFSKRYRGTGKDRKTAINNALSSILTSDQDFSNFLTDGQRVIVAYYEQNESLIFSRAAAKAGQNEYHAAIALLMSVPENASCYKNALAQASEYYRMYLNAGCYETIRRAKIRCAGQQYIQALDELAYSDIWATQCAEEEKELIAQISAQVSEQEILKYERKREERKFQQEKHRFNALMELTERYFSQLGTIDDQNNSDQ
jgi:hypothetical protein